jgi:voltage-gated potassium channel Kch
MEHSQSAANAIVICGFGSVGETVARALSYPPVVQDFKIFDAEKGNDDILPYVAFDLDPELVIKGHKSGYSVMYGDGSQPLVLSTAGVVNPRAFIVTFDEEELCLKTVERLHFAYPKVPIYARYLALALE